MSAGLGIFAGLDPSLGVAWYTAEADAAPGIRDFPVVATCCKALRRDSILEMSEDNWCILFSTMLSLLLWSAEEANN
jgi:hypothetical protein